MLIGHQDCPMLLGISFKLEFLIPAQTCRVLWENFYGYGGVKVSMLVRHVEDSRLNPKSSGSANCATLMHIVKQYYGLCCTLVAKLSPLPIGYRRQMIRWLAGGVSVRQLYS